LRCRSEAVLPLLSSRTWWQGRGVAQRCFLWLLFPGQPWRREGGGVEHGEALFGASSGRFCLYRSHVLPLLLDLAPRWRQWQQERRFVRRLPRVSGASLQQLAATCFVSPSGPKRCRAPAPTASVLPCRRLSPCPAPTGCVPRRWCGGRSTVTSSEDWRRARGPDRVLD
jgi:hypothetical protein